MTADPIRDFVAYAQTLDGDEKGEAQVFLDRFFQAFGHAGYKEAGATLEDRVRRKGRSTGFADLVWPGRVLVEMKKRGAALQKHYDQARDYWFNLYPKPQYVLLCNFDEVWIYDFDVQPDPVDTVALDRLAERRAAFGFMLPQPETPLFENNRVDVTREAAHTVAQVYTGLVDGGEDPDRARRFVLQCVAAMFFEDVGLLPGNVFAHAVDDCLHGGADAYDVLGGLFRQMADPTPARGGRFAAVPYFNGGLFRDVEPVALGKAGLLPLLEAARSDWRRVQPEILGTLFQDVMDPEKRHAQGAHFTHEADIQKIVQPTVVRPWRERIAATDTLAGLKDLRDDLLRYRVLDPACGSGNFLYVAFRELKRVEIEVVAKVVGAFSPAAIQRAGFARTSRVSVRQMYGLDHNAFAVDLARVTLTIAQQAAARDAARTAEADATGALFEDPLPLDDLTANVRQADALFADWPDVEAVIGNPPFVSKNKMAPELGAAYVDRVRRAYPDVPGRADYCVYWFRKAHDHLGAGGRAGLVGTNTIRQNYSREGGLDYVVANGGTITEAVSSQPWTGDAAVHVSIANWIKGDEPGPRRLFYQDGDGPNDELELYEVERIGPALSPEVDVTGAEDLAVNKDADACYQGQVHGHAGFLLSPKGAASLLAADPASAELLHPYMTGNDLVGNAPPGPSRFAIDLNDADDVIAARAGGAAFERLRAQVLPTVEEKAAKERAKGNENGTWTRRLDGWWRYGRARGEMLGKLAGVSRYVGCSRVTKRPIFAFIDTAIRPNDTVQVFPLDDDYSFGIVQSSLHWAWFVARCSTLESRFRYTSSTIFNTFPWPQAPALAEAAAVAEAAVALRQLRRDVMGKLGYSFRDLYRTLDEPGANPLRAAHARLDAAVRAAYGFAPEAEPLAALLALNHAVADRQSAGEPVVGPGLPPSVSDPAPFVTADCIAPPPLPMIRVFISHSHADVALAAALTTLIRQALPLTAPEIRCTSVPGHKLPAGAHSPTQLRREVREATVLVGLISTASLDSLYVAFELGARWGTDGALIPLFAPGFDLAALSGPLSNYNGLRCDDSTDLLQFVDDLAEALGVEPERPSAYHAALEAVRAVPPTPPQPDTFSAGAARPPAPEPPPPEDAEAVIRDHCEAEWGDNFSMLAYCIDRQRDALAALQAGAPSGVPDDVFARIRERAAAEWPSDFTMRQYTEQREVEAYRKTH